MKTLFCIFGSIFFLHSVSAADVSEEGLQRYFKNHTVAGNRVAALKKRIIGNETAYLATIHGYPNNLAVCEDLIAPYNTDSSKSVLPGTYFCELL